MVVKIEVSTTLKSLFSIAATWQWDDFIIRNPKQVGDEPCEEILTETLLSDARRINLAINTLFYARDKKDYWQIAIDSGDCEDLMLAKRYNLHELGYDFGALRPVICKTEEDVWHAVLCLSTDLGDYILDNRHSMIMPWARLPYHWGYRWAGKTWEILSNV